MSGLEPVEGCPKKYGEERDEGCRISIKGVDEELAGAKKGEGLPMPDPGAEAVEPGLYKGIRLGACARSALRFVVVGVEPALDPVVGNDREFTLGSGTLGVVTLLLELVGEDFNESVLRPAWNLRNAANAAASLALGPDDPPPDVTFESEDFAPSFASGGVLFGTVITCLTGVGAGGAGPDGGLDEASRSMDPGDETSPEGAFLGVESPCGWPRSFSAGGTPHGYQVPPALKPWNCRGG